MLSKLLLIRPTFHGFELIPKIRYRPYVILMWLSRYFLKDINKLIKHRMSSLPSNQKNLVKEEFYPLQSSTRFGKVCLGNYKRHFRDKIFKPFVWTHIFCHFLKMTLKKISQPVKTIFWKILNHLEPQALYRKFSKEFKIYFLDFSRKKSKLKMWQNFGHL